MLRQVIQPSNSTLQIQFPRYASGHTETADAICEVLSGRNEIFANFLTLLLNPTHKAKV